MCFRILVYDLRHIIGCMVHVGFGLLVEIHCWYISWIHWHMVYGTWLKHIMSDMMLV
jgi:hypothetical protein